MTEKPEPGTRNAVTDAIGHQSWPAAQFAFNDDGTITLGDFTARPSGTQEPDEAGVLCDVMHVVPD